MSCGTRGLPGFLRRSRRRDDFEDTEDENEDDSHYEDDDDTDDINTIDGISDGCSDGLENDNHDTSFLPRSLSSSSSPNNNKTNNNSVLNPSPLAERSAQDDYNKDHKGNKNGNDEHRNISYNETSNKYSSNGNNNNTDDDNDSVSTLGESDSVHNNHSRKSVLMSNNNIGGSGNEMNDYNNNHTSRRSSTNSTIASKTYRETQFEKILCMNDIKKSNSNSNNVVKMTELRKIGWNGIPPQYRGMSWKILLGYLPTNAMRRQQTLERKRAEYKEAIKQHYYIDDNSRTIQEQETLRQVLVDVPRTAPDVPLFRNEKIKRALSRLLYIWAMRHPASSYVQGINDLATPLFAVYLADDYEGEDVLDGSVMVVLEEERLDEVEADVYWCLTNILAGIQDHYTADQPGIQRMVMRLQELINRIDADLYNHIQSVGIQFMQFAFRWMNCLLLREFNLKCVIRLWDTYISEDGLKGFEDFHVYVCAAFLSQFSSQLQERDFDELFQFMQQVPTDDWGETEIEMLLSHAYVLSTLFGGSDAHLTGNSQVAPISM